MKKLLFYILIIYTTLPVIGMKRIREEPREIKLIVSDVNPADLVEQYIELSAYKTKMYANKDVLTKIPILYNLIEETNVTTIDLTEYSPTPVSKIAMAFILEVIETIYSQAPVLQKDPSFFEKTETHPAYTPADIPLQVKNIAFQRLNNINSTQQLLANILIACHFFGLPWLAEVVAKKWITQQYTLQQAQDIGLDRDLIFNHLEPYYKNISLINEQSIADMVALNHLPPTQQNIDSTEFKGMDFSNQILVSLVGLHLIPKDILKDTEALNLSYNQITAIPDNIFIGFNNLKNLDLNNNKITFINRNAFAGLSKLEELDLDYNKITSIDENSFASLNNIELLSLAHNQISSIDKNTFTQLNNLISLYLDNNKITTINENIFAKLNTLQILYLRNNQINIIPKNIFTQLSNLETLYLENNQIQSIDQNSFAGLNNLIELDLANNQITTIAPNAFSDLNNLDELNLANNQIQSIDQNTFNGLNNLDKLSLNGNAITTIADYAFRQLAALEQLGLSNNQITTITENTFAGLNSLDNLWLHDNQITTIAPNAFLGLNLLDLLELDNNRISTIAPNTFSGLNNLINLWIRNNPLSKATRKYISDVLPNTNIEF